MRITELIQSFYSSYFLFVIVIIYNRNDYLNFNNTNLLKKFVLIETYTIRLFLNGEEGAAINKNIQNHAGLSICQTTSLHQEFGL